MCYCGIVNLQTWYDLRAGLYVVHCSELSMPPACIFFFLSSHMCCIFVSRWIFSFCSPWVNTMQGSKCPVHAFPFWASPSPWQTTDSQRGQLVFTITPFLTVVPCICLYICFNIMCYAIKLGSNFNVGTINPSSYCRQKMYWSNKSPNT